MIDRIAAPFWVCWSIGLVIALVTGDFELWLSISAAIGIALGLILRARTIRKRQGNSQRRTIQVTPRITAPPPSQVRPSGVDLDSVA
jgi:hypothetical protein